MLDITAETKKVREDMEKQGYVLTEEEYQIILEYTIRKSDRCGKGRDYVPLLLEDEIKNYYFRNTVTAISLINIPNEDEYWERRREEYERVPKGWKPEPERQILSLDDELDDLEKEYGCKLEDLNEPDIEEIVFRIRGEYPMSAEYDPAFIAIFYKVDPDWRYNIW